MAWVNMKLLYAAFYWSYLLTKSDSSKMCSFCHKFVVNWFQHLGGVLIY